MGKIMIFLFAVTIPPALLYLAMGAIGSLFTSSNMFDPSDWEATAKALFVVLVCWWVGAAI